jgi:hypothetical protein
MFQIDGHLACQRDTLSTDRPNQIRIERDSNGLARKEIRLYNAYASTIPVGHPCLVRYDGDEETNPFVVSGASASGTAILEIFCTPQVAVPASSWGWFTIEGYCQALVEGTTDVAKDDFLKLVIGYDFRTDQGYRDPAGNGELDWHCSGCPDGELGGADGRVSHR